MPAARPGAAAPLWDRRSRRDRVPAPAAGRSAPGEESCVFSEHCSERNQKEEGKKNFKKKKNVESYIKNWIVLVTGHLQSDMQCFMWFAKKSHFNEVILLIHALQMMQTKFRKNKSTCSDSHGFYNLLSSDRNSDLSNSKISIVLFSVFTEIM